MQAQRKRQTDGDLEYVVDRFAIEAARLTREQRVVRFFAISHAVFEDYRRDPHVDQAWVAAAHASWIQVGLLLMRAKGYSGEAAEIEAAIGLAGGPPAGRH